MNFPDHGANHTGNFYKSQIKNQQQEILNLQDESKKLYLANQELAFQNQKLQNENHDLIIQINALKQRNSLLYSEYLNLKNLYQNLEKQIIVMRGELSNLHNSHKKIKTENFQLRNSIEEKEQTIEKLNAYLNELSNQINSLESDKTNGNNLHTTTNKFFNEHYQNAILNDFRGKNYYPDSLKDIFTIISFIGKSWYSILQQIFNLPHYRTVQRYRNIFLQILQFSVEIFDGEITNLQKLVKLFANEKDLRYVISIDAVSLKSYVSISPDGTVKGLKFIKQIPIDYAKICLENDHEFSLMVSILPNWAKIVSTL